jgi:hypothetical protein
MSAIKIDRGPSATPWLLHATTIEEVDAHLQDIPRRLTQACAEVSPSCLEQIAWVNELADKLLDLRNELRSMEESA